LDTLVLLDIKNLKVISDHQFDKEGKQSFIEKTKRRGITTSEKDGSFYKNET